MPQLSRTTTLVLLVMTAVVAQRRLVVEAILPAPDAVDTVAVAQRFIVDGLVETLRTERPSPLFPLLVGGVHEVATRLGVHDPQDWAAPCQWVAAAALVLSTIPIFLTAERLVDRPVAVLTVLLFIALPTIARLGADGLADALQLGFVAGSVWLLVSERPTTAGLAVAAAMLIRPEAALLPVAACIVAAASAFRAPRSALRVPSSVVPRFVLAASVWIVPYVAVGVTSPSMFVERLRGSAAPSERVPLNFDSSATLHDAVTRSRATSEDAIKLGRKDPDRSSRFHGLVATLDEFVDELLQASGYVLLPLAGIGIYCRRRFSRTPTESLLCVAVGLHLTTIAVMAWRGGYLSARHFAMPVMFSLPYAAVGLMAVCRWTAERLQAASPTLELRLRFAVLTGLVAAALAATAAPVHESLAGHRRAAEWIASNSQSADAVLDQQGYSALYSGRTTYRFGDAETAFVDPQLRYVVLERQDLEADTPRGATLRRLLGPAESAVAAFSADRGRRRREVLIFTPSAVQFASRENRDAR